MPKGIYTHKKGKMASRWNGGKIDYICRFCNKIRKAFPSQVRTFCSRACALKGTKPRHTVPHTQATKDKIAQKKKLNPNKNLFIKGHPFIKGGEKGWFKKGQKPSNWQGGKRTLSQRIKDDVCWKKWRESVFRRDNWTCQVCGIRGTVLHPHHKIRKVIRVDLAFDLNNGMTVCVPCHKNIHRKKL